VALGFTTGRWSDTNLASVFLFYRLHSGQALVHALMERIEMGSTCTLYCHGMTHVWAQAPLETHHSPFSLQQNGCLTVTCLDYQSR
jgi:hypothetical protein